MVGGAVQCSPQLGGCGTGPTADGLFSEPAGGLEGSQVDDSEQIDGHTQEWVRQINTSGEAFLSPALLDGAWMVRISVGVEATERRHLERLIELMRAAAEENRGAAA